MESGEVMSDKTALTYALESLKWYEENSWMNPKNMRSPLMKDETDRGIEFRMKKEVEWAKTYNEQKIVTYLETILERLPYELPKEDK
jgi:hypothetical protein